MKTVAATELKARLAEFLGDVERGEVINVTRHGKTIARLSPPDDQDEARRRHEAVEAIKTWKRTGRKTGITVDEILSARDEGRK